MTAVPERLRVLNDAPVRGSAEYVLYWMVAFRRTRANPALEHAVQWAAQLNKPLVVLEALRVGYRWASDRHHRFVLDGMRDNHEAFLGQPVTYYPYVEGTGGEGKGLLACLAARACLVVTDDWPSFFVPRMQRAAATLPVRLEAVDGNGLMPIRAATQPFARAFDFRRFLQRHLASQLETFPSLDPLMGCSLAKLSGEALDDICARWPRASDWLSGARALSELPIDHNVTPALLAGGSVAARQRLRAFVSEDLPVYAEGRNHPDDDRASGLSPWLHFGHLSTFEVFQAVVEAEGWSKAQLSPQASGKREGFWNMSPGAEAFLDELVTWRELGYSTAALDPHYDSYEGLPGWARNTLAEHAHDERKVYPFEALEAGRSEDDIWNAAQRQLVQEGRMHNYLRMLWGKCILMWTASPQDALEVMIELNNKYALDGRDPNSYSGILWVLGRYDRAWGPERPIFGKVRYMTSDSTRKKLRLKRYLARWCEGGSASKPSQIALL